MSTHRWCEHGYNVAFSKSIKELGTQFKAAIINEEIPVSESVAKTIEVKETKLVEPIETKESEPELLAEESPKVNEESDGKAVEEKTRKVLGK